jgi:hypothetical protein
MKTIATLDKEAAAQLSAYLAGLQISCTARPSTEEGGIEGTELSVDDDRFDSACDAAEVWYEAKADEVARKQKRVCRKCASPHLAYEEDETLGGVYRCSDCGAVIVP